MKKLYLEFAAFVHSVAFYALAGLLLLRFGSRYGKMAQPSIVNLFRKG